MLALTDCVGETEEVVSGRKRRDGGEACHCCGLHKSFQGKGPGMTIGEFAMMREPLGINRRV
jgi:hypothetical protein